MNIKLMEPHALKQAVDLSDQVFLNSEQPSMGSSFPLIFDPGFSHSYGAFDEHGNVTAFMGLVPFTIRTEAAQLKVFSIGSVCTDPDQRGKGLAGELLEACKAHAERSGASLIFVSGDRSLYTRAGCRHFGRVMEHRLMPEGAQELKNKLQAEYQIREMKSEDIFAMHELLTKRNTAYMSSVSELGRLLDASAYANVLQLDQKVLIAEQNGGIAAFAVIGVPGNRMTTSAPATLIEWAGEAEAAASILSEAIPLYGLTELLISLAWQDQELSDYLESAGAAKNHIQNSGTIFLVNGQELLRQLAPLIPEEAAGMLQAEGDHGPYLYKQGSNTIELDDEGLISLLFDPESPHRVTAAGSEMGGQDFMLRPIPLPYTAGLQYI
ncbi:GNAT family N-acetyltransferase [Paenibacillus dakarensis]|uniref:GNAT family N-acetyltransferase n=1 Tax=Paenibacillus dakarensis TaxID=1527293 RepID=UPI0006D551F7|nr:GNAT family N-acetyltransferase [Paenibacillus dakarensis]